MASYVLLLLVLLLQPFNSALPVFPDHLMSNGTNRHRKYRNVDLMFQQFLETASRAIQTALPEDTSISLTSALDGEQMKLEPSPNPIPLLSDQFEPSETAEAKPTSESPKIPKFVVSPGNAPGLEQDVTFCTGKIRRCIRRTRCAIFVQRVNQRRKIRLKNKFQLCRIKCGARAVVCA